MCKKDKKPANKLPTWQTESYRAGSLAGIMDGADVTTFNHEPRELLTGVCQKLREPWMVSDFSDVTEVAGLPEGEKGRQKVVAAKVLKFALEGRCLSNEECSTDNGTTVPNAMRGAAKWILATAQTKYPVPASFRPASGNIHASTLAALTETVFEGLLASAFKERKAKLSLDGFVGITLKMKFSNWTARDPEASASSYPVRMFNQDAAKAQMIKVVDFLKFDAGEVRLHLSTYLYLSAAGAASDYTHRSGLFLNMDMWALAFMRRPRMVELQDEGGGPRGFADLIGTLKCFNPLGQIKVESSS